MRYYYGILYPREDFHANVVVGDEFLAIGTAFPTAREAEEQVMQEHADVGLKGLPVVAAIVETDEYGIVTDVYEATPRARRHNNPVFGGMAPFFFSDGSTIPQAGFAQAPAPGVTAQPFTTLPAQTVPAPAAVAAAPAPAAPPRKRTQRAAPQAPSRPEAPGTPEILSDAEIEVRLREAMQSNAPSAKALPKETFGQFAEYLGISVKSLPSDTKAARRMFRDAARERFGWEPPKRGRPAQPKSEPKSQRKRRAPSKSRTAPPKKTDYTDAEVAEIVENMRKAAQDANEGKVLSSKGKPVSARDAATASDVMPLEAADEIAEMLGMDFDKVKADAEASGTATTTYIKREIGNALLTKYGLKKRRGRPPGTSSRSAPPKPKAPEPPKASAPKASAPKAPEPPKKSEPSEEDFARLLRGGFEDLRSRISSGALDASL